MGRGEREEPRMDTNWHENGLPRRGDGEGKVRGEK
jgi:hypothetical protein